MAVRNVVLVCLDAARKDVFDEYAAQLNERADITYRRCRAVSGWSVPSHASMFTGTLPSEHGVHAFHRDFSEIDRRDTFLGDLPTHRAIGASANVYASEAFGFDELFDAFRSLSPDRRFQEGMDAERWGQECDRDRPARYLAFLRAALAHKHPIQSVANGAFVELDRVMADLPIKKPLDDGAKLVARGARKLISDGTEPFVLFTNFMDIHGPLTPVRGYDKAVYDAPASWSSRALDTRAVERGNLDRHSDDVNRYRELYDAATEYLDRIVTELVDDIHRQTDYETTVIITADHGENLGYEADDRLFAHRSGLTEGLLHVPMIVLNAPDDTSPTAVDGYVSHLRLGELIVELAGGDVPDVTEDVIVAERVGFNTPASRSTSTLRDADRMIRVAYEQELKYEWDSLGTRKRYTLDPDQPSWQGRVVSGDEVPIEQYESTLFDVPITEYRQRVEETEENATVDESVERRLKELGYR